MNIILIERCQKDIKKLGKKYRSMANDVAGLLESLQSNPMQDTAWGVTATKFG